MLKRYMSQGVVLTQRQADMLATFEHHDGDPSSAQDLRDTFGPWALHTLRSLLKQKMVKEVEMGIGLVYYDISPQGRFWLRFSDLEVRPA